MAAMKALLKTLDADGSGTITAQECKDFLNKPLEKARESVDLVLKLAGEQDGKLEIEAFIK